MLRKLMFLHLTKSLKSDNNIIICMNVRITKLLNINVKACSKALIESIPKNINISCSAQNHPRVTTSIQFVWKQPQMYITTEF